MIMKSEGKIQTLSKNWGPKLLTFLRKILRDLLYQTEGLNQEKDIGSQKSGIQEKGMGKKSQDNSEDKSLIAAKQA